MGVSVLRIRRAQMEIFADAAQRRFEDEQVQRLVQAHDPAEGPADEAALRDYVQHVVKNALVWGIDEIEDVEQLIDWCREEGPDFHLVEGREEAREILEDASIAGFAKIVVLREDVFEVEEGQP